MKIGIIDTMALLYSAKFGMPKLYAENQGTGILFGFTRYLFNLQKTHHFDKIIFAIDSVESKRKDLYPGYKSGRKFDESREFIYSQFEIVKNEILPWIGFKNIFGSDGLEADDIIASLCQTKDPDDEYVIISRDADLFQLITDTVSQYDFVSRKMITKRSFTEKYGIDPVDWSIVKTLGGCKSDSVPGIRGVGEKSACKFINETLKESSHAFKKIVSEDNKFIIERNKPLVTLPFAGTPEFEIVDDRIFFDSLIHIFQKFEFQSLLISSVLDEWRNLFDWSDIEKRKTIFDF